MKNCVLKGNKSIIKISNDLGVSEDFVRTIAMENPSLSDKGLFFETAKTINRIALNTRVNSNNEGISSNSFVNHVRNRIESNAVFNYNNTESAVEVSILNGEPLITIDSNLSRATVDSLIANTSAQELLRQILPELDALSDLFTSDNQLKSFLMRYASLVVENGLPNIFAVEGVLSTLTSPEAQAKVLSEAYKQSIKDVSDYPLSSAMLLSENAKEREYGNNIRNYHNIVRSFLGNNTQLVRRFLRDNEALNKVLSFLGVDMTVRKTSVGVFFTPEKSNTQLSLEDKYIALETLFQSYLSEAESQDDTALPKFTEFGKGVDMRRLTDLMNRYIADKFAHQSIPLIRRVPFESLPLSMVNNYTAMKAVLDLLERQYGFDMTELQDAIEDSYVSNFDDFLTDVFTHIQSLNNTNPREALPFQINLANKRLKKLVKEAKLQDTQSILDSLKKTAPQGDSLESLISAVSPDTYVNHIFSGILDTLRTKVKHGKSTFNSQFISLLENILDNNHALKYTIIEVSDSLPEGRYGEYYEEDNKIILSSKIPNIPELGINFENVLIHEILHAATINAPTALKKKLFAFLDIVNAQIRTNLENEITNSTGYKRSKDKKAYLEGKINEFYTDINYQSLTKPMEFLADFFRNKELASLLNDLDATGTVVVRKKGIFETIVDFIKDIFRLKRPEREISALDEASQLVNDAIVLGSQTARTKISDYKKARDRVIRTKKLNRANMLHKVGKASENIKYLPKILKSLEETRPDIASKLLDRELNTYKGISPMIQYLYSLYESGVIDTSDLTTINNFGVFSKDFLKRALEYMQKDNFEGYVSFAPKNLKSNLTIKETILLREAGRITAKPIAKYNNHFYSIVVKRNGNYDLNNLQAREKIEVSFKDGIVRRADNGQILEDIYSPLFFAEKPPTKDLQMIQAYDNDMTVVNTKVRALVREVSFIFDDLLEIKQRTVPTMTREKMINSLTFDQLRELIYNKLQYYSDNSDDSNREAVGLFSEHIDALIARSLSHLQFTEKLTFKSRYLKNKNKKQEESDIELPDDKTAEEDSEGDDLLEAGETQSIQYNIKADTRKIFDKTSVKLKKVLYNLVDISATPEEVTGSFPTIDVNLVKDVLLEALDSIFDPNDVMIALEYYSEAYPFLLDLIDQIEDDPTLLTQIYNTFTLTRVDALSVKPDMKHPFQKVNHVFLKTNKITSWASNVSEGVRLDPDYYVTSGAGVQNKAQLSKRIKKVTKLAAEVRQDLKALPRLTEQERENAYPGIVRRLMHIIHSVGVESSRDRLFVHLKGTLHESKDPMKKALKLINIISSSLSVVEKNINKNKAALYTSQEISHSLSKMFSRVYTELQSIDFQRGESYVNEGGKGYYLNRQPSYISKMLDGFKTNKPWLNTQEKIERRREFLNKHFFSYPGTYARINPIKTNNREIRFFSDFIERMVNDPDFANNNTYVSFKNINIAGTRIEFKNLSENMQLAVLMSGFFSNEKVKVSEYKDALMDSSEAYFPFNNFSDSPELGFIKGIRYTGEDYKDRINTNLTNLAISELKRISVVKKAKEEGVMPDVANLSERGDTFVKFPFLEEIKDELLGLLDTAPTEIHGRIKAAFETHLERTANEFADSILYESEDGVVFKVPEVQSIVAHGRTLSGQDYKDRLTEYYYNQYNAYAEFTHLLGIDHAMYKNAVEFQKRFKQVYSHGVPLNTSAKIPEVTVDMDTGNIISTGEFVKTGKSKRVTIVLSDYRVFSSVSNEMIRSITEAFPNNIEQRVKILSSLGVYNHGEMVIGGDTYARSVTLGTFIKNDTHITGEEYFKVMGENPGAEKKYYIDAEDPGNMYETQRMNITDGQTFLSLSEMRSMMSMYDNWTIENEIEFQKYQVYKENDVPVEGIFSKFYNSIKSFYFGTAPLKVNGENLKNNIQFKHSEALLAPNDIMGSSELLQNISRFLENPPTVMVDGVEYQIGAISFDSTQKTGSHNVININDLNPADVEQTLRNAVADGKYTVTDYSNYIIQQPTPNHITNNTKQLVGTQSRRILYSDIPADATFEIAGEVYNKEEYTDIVNNIVNKGIRKAFDKLQKRFKDNKALSELLIDTVLSSNLYHKDLVNAFKLDKHGNFKLPLFNPANSVMVERMITSIIRTNVTKQYIRGGKVVNTSNVGYSEDLKILFETKNGKLIPTFFEVYAPFPGTEQEWRELHDADGNFLWENVDEKFREMVFYRIPTESKYSIVPVRVKEFLPPSSGVSFILPNEISTLTGLDFDIDAMYGFINDYTFSKGKLSVIPSSHPDNFLSDDLRLKRRAAQNSPQQGQELSNYYEGDIKPEPNTVFVFGSNPIGVNGNPSKYPRMSASVATSQFGVKQGEKVDNKMSESGNAFGLTTVTRPGARRSKTAEQIVEGIKVLYETAKANPNKDFKVAYRNTATASYNGYTGLEMIDMFNEAGVIPDNIIFSKEWFDTGKLNIPKASSDSPRFGQESNTLESKLKTFFNGFGFQFKEGESSTDLLHKIIYTSNKDSSVFIDNSVKALSQLLLANTNIDFHRLETLIEGTPEFKKLLRGSSQYLKDTHKFLKDGNRIPMEEWIAYIKQYNKIKNEVLEKYLKGSLLDNNNSTGLHKLINDFLKWFRDLFTNAKNLKEVTDSLVQQALLNQREVIINSKDLQNKERVTLAKALEETTHGKDIIKTFGEFGLILTGSVSAAEQGSIFRKTGKLLHDIDWVVPKGFTKDFNKKLKDTYPGVTLVREFDSPTYYTQTYIVPPKGHTISNLTFFKPETYGERKYIASYDVLDKNGNIVSNYRRYYDVKESGKVVENREVYNEGFENVDKNLEAVSVDFFQQKEDIKYEPYTVNVEGVNLQLANWLSSFTEKLKYGRAKDLLDYANFIPDDLVSQTSQLSPQQKQQAPQSNNTVKPGVSELFKSNPELANIGTPEQYSEYLDTIFPDSKVRDIVYHGVLRGKESYNNILTEGFRTTGVPKYQTGISEDENSGIYFSTDFALASNYGTEHIDVQDDGTGKRGMIVNHYIVPAIVNIKNLSSEFGELSSDILRIKKNDPSIDGVQGIEPDTPYNITVVFEPEQIHILGSKQDIEGFKAFTKGIPSPSVSPTVRRSTNTSDNNLLIDLFLANLNNEFSVQERFKLGGFDGLMETSYEIALLRQGYTKEQLAEMDRMPNPLRHKRNLVESASRDMNAIENDLFFRNQSIVGMNNVPIFVNNRSLKNFLSSLKGAHIQLNRSKGHVAIQTDLVRLLVKGAESGKIPLIRAEYVDDDGNIRKPKDDVSEDAAAAVDIAKSPVHPNIGLNPYNTQAYTTLRFIGADSRKINSIMANPLISWEIPYRFELLRKPGPIFDTVKAFVSIYDYKLGYDLLNPKLDATSLKTALQAAAKRAGIENEQVENMSMELLEESMNYLALSINTIAYTLSEFSNINKTDAVNNGPSLSIENMVKTNLEFDRVTRDSNKALKVVTTEDFDNNFVVNFHEYTFNKALEALSNSFNVKVIEKVYTILDMFSENKEVIQAIYLSYAYDNVKMYDGSAVNSLVLDAFPNYFIESLRSDPKYNDSWLLNNLEHDTKAFFINAYQKPDKDRIIGDWMKMFNDPNHREDAYNLAVYSYFRRSSTKGLNNLYYMIPSDIQTELNLFTDINDNPELLDEYILSESIAKVMANTKYLNKLKDMAAYFPASEIMEGDVTERVLEIIGKQMIDGTYFSSFYKINKDIYYYDAANHDLVLLSDLADYLPATLEEKTNITHDDINKEEREVVEENETAMESPSETDVTDEMTYDTEVFSSKYYKDIKQIETLTELLDSMEASIIDLQQSEDPLQQDLYNAGVSYLEIVSENYDEFPEFDGMSSEEIEREINDTKSCLL